MRAVFCGINCSLMTNRLPGLTSCLGGKAIGHFSVFSNRFLPKRRFPPIFGKRRQSPALRSVGISSSFSWTADNSLALPPTNGHSQIISPRLKPAHQLSSSQILAAMQRLSSRVPADHFPPMHKFPHSHEERPTSSNISCGRWSARLSSVGSANSLSGSALPALVSIGCTSGSTPHLSTTPTNPIENPDGTALHSVYT